MRHDPRTDFPAWCREQGACEEGQAFADTCPTLADFWRACQRSDWMLWVDERADILTDKDRRLFAVWCARLCNPTDLRSMAAIDCAERFAHRQATTEELSAAESAARSAARSAAWSAAESAAWSAAWPAAWLSAESAAESAARSVAESAAESAQAGKLREMVAL